MLRFPWWSLDFIKCRPIKYLLFVRRPPGDDCNGCTDLAHFLATNDVCI